MNRTKDLYIIFFIKEFSKIESDYVDYILVYRNRVYRWIEIFLYFFVQEFQRIHETILPNPVHTLVILNRIRIYQIERKKDFQEKYDERYILPS